MQKMADFLFSKHIFEELTQLGPGVKVGQKDPERWPQTEQQTNHSQCVHHINVY